MPKTKATPVNACLGETLDVQATVFAVIPEFHQVDVCTPDGNHYTITRHTPGVDWSTLRDGQQLHCTVTRRLARVLSVRTID